MRDLKATDLLEVVSNPKMLKMWLSNPIALEAYEEAVTDVIGSIHNDYAEDETSIRDYLNVRKNPTNHKIKVSH